jgi:hypothetical protein
MLFGRLDSLDLDANLLFRLSRIRRQSRYLDHSPLLLLRPDGSLKMIAYPYP